MTLQMIVTVDGTAIEKQKAIRATLRSNPKPLDFVGTDGQWMVEVFRRLLDFYLEQDEIIESGFGVEVNVQTARQRALKVART